MVSAPGATASIRLSRELRGKSIKQLILVLCVDIQLDSSYSVGLENENDMFLWNVCFEGSEDSIYEVSISLLSH